MCTLDYPLCGAALRAALHLSAALFVVGAGAADAISTTDLLATRSNLAGRIENRGGWTADAVDGGWRVSGRSGGPIVWAPASGERWNLSGWNYVSVELVNRGDTVVTVDGRLDNPGAQDWTACSPSSAVVPPGGRATLGFPFTRADGAYRGAEIFRPQLARPNGHRLHWRGFDPADVRALRLVVRSAGADVQLSISEPRLAWPVDSARDAALEEMPYLDAFGQVRALDWPGKAVSEEQLRGELARHAAAVARAGWPTGFDRFGGWAAGPQLEATGHFRTEKREGRWWLVDPDGRLFWSAGVCGVGWEAATALTPQRRAAGFFSALPATNDPAYAVGMREGKKPAINFPALNLWRAFGTNWEARATELIHDELHAWGVNTLAAWSSGEVMRRGRTPYTLTTGVWWPVWREGGSHRPSPFAADFEKNVRAELTKLAWAKDDPFCLGVFVDNELDWPDQFAPALFDAPSWEPTRAWAQQRLQEKYADISALNAAWGITAKEWKDVWKKPASGLPAAAAADLEPLYEDYVRAYFAGCRRVINEVLPGKLYLGCRTHRGPKVMGRAARGLVDVFSVNCYDVRAGVHQLGGDVDMPVLVGEFHFGAVDRGVPSPGLRAVADQRQRGLAYAQYLASGLADPRIVGAHWFQWLDQPASGRGDRENHQVGFVDVTGRPHPDFVRGVASATSAMYPARAAGGSVEQVLSQLLKTSGGDLWRRGDPAPFIRPEVRPSPANVRWRRGDPAPSSDSQEAPP